MTAETLAKAASGHDITIQRERTMNPTVVSREEWLIARNDLLAEEREVTHRRDRLAVPKGRNEHGPMSWLWLHDEYEERRRAEPEACCDADR